MSFDNMGPSWTAVRDGARQGTLRKTATEVGDVAARWDDLMRYLGLELTKDLGRDVRQALRKDERTPAARQAALRESLSSSGRLYAELDVPNVTGSLEVEADLRSRQLIVSTQIDAPREGRSKGRVSWLLRQLQKAPENVNLEARVARTSTLLAASLQAVRETPDLLYPESGKEVRQFRIILTRNMGLKRSAGQGSFIDSVIGTTKDFYGDVLQNLRAWKAPPPKLKKPAEESEETLSHLAPGIAEAVELAEEEMGRAPRGNFLRGFVAEALATSYLFRRLEQTHGSTRTQT